MRMVSLRKSAGLGLMESIMVFLFVTISIVGIAKLSSYLYNQSNVNNQRLESTLIASNNLEKLRDYPDVAGYQNISSGSNSSSSTNTTYDTDWMVINNASQNYKTINQNSSWVDNFNNTFVVRLSSGVVKLEPASSALLMSNIFTPVPQGKPKKKPKK